MPAVATQTCSIALIRILRRSLGGYSAVAVKDAVTLLGLGDKKRSSSPGDSVAGTFFISNCPTINVSFTSVRIHSIAAPRSMSLSLWNASTAFSSVIAIKIVLVEVAGGFDQRRTTGR